MIICIDIGNTNVVVGIYFGDELLERWCLDSKSHRTCDEWFLILQTLLKNNSLDLGGIKGIIISSVVPELTSLFKELCEKNLKIEPLEITGESEIGIKNRYNNPMSVGADRLCNAIAGFERYGGPLIIIDFGTATTFDVVSIEGDYLGGVISPGIETASINLHRAAAKLPSVDLTFPDEIIGKTTIGSIQSGIMYGAVEAVDGLVRRIEKELGEKCKVIATGGLSSIISKYSRTIEACDVGLTLTGMKIIYHRMTK